VRSGIVLAALAALPVLASPPQDPPRPDVFEARGRLVCLLEEMKEAYQVEVKPIHEHLWGFRIDDKDGRRYVTLLRTRIAEGLFVDEAFRKRDLRLIGRTFPASGLLEVSRTQWFRDGRAHDVFYWCEVCAIKQWDPGTCACCQGDVELRDSPAGRD